MTFAHPSLLWVALVLPPLLAAGLYWSWRTRQRLITCFVPKRLQESLTLGISPRRATVRAALLTVGLLSLLLALARPRYGAGTIEVSQRGLDILVAIDTSRSMLAEDAGPGISRLQRAKLAALDLARLARTDRIGLVAFAGGAFLQCPLTIDFEAFRQSVDALDTGVIQQGGTAIGPAIHTALEAFTEEKANVRALVLFTDGEEHEPGALDAAKRAESKGLRIFTVGVGTAQGEVIRLKDANGATTYLKDSQGNAVKSTLNESLLREVATKTGGLYLPLQGPRAMSELYTRGLEPLPKGNLDARLMEQFEERFQIPLAVAILLILWETLLPERSRVGNRLRASRRTHPSLGSTASGPAAATTVLLAGLLSVFFSHDASASPDKALKQYRKADYSAAQTEFERLARENPKDPRLSFNAGTAAYRAGDLASASEHFQHSLASTDLQLQTDAFYNLGNTQFQLGEKAKEPAARQKAWENAIQSFEAALKIAEQNADAKHNLDFVRQRLEDLKQQQQQQKQQGKNDKDSKNDQKSEDDQKPEDSKQDPKQQDKEKDKDNESQKPDEKQGDNDSSPPEDKSSPKPDKAGSDNPAKDEPKDTDNQSPKDDSANPVGQNPDKSQDASPSQPGEEAPAGQMSPQQALRLLDATKGEEKLMPLEKKRARARNYKDW